MFTVLLFLATIIRLTASLTFSSTLVGSIALKFSNRPGTKPLVTPELHARATKFVFSSSSQLF